MFQRVFTFRVRFVSSRNAEIILHLRSVLLLLLLFSFIMYKLYSKHIMRLASKILLPVFNCKRSAGNFNEKHIDYT